MTKSGLQSKDSLGICRAERVSDMTAFRTTIAGYSRVKARPCTTNCNTFRGLAAARIRFRWDFSETFRASGRNAAIDLHLRSTQQKTAPVFRRGGVLIWR
jgi:hypothetical protein